MKNPLVGRWRLVSWEYKTGDGKTSFPFGKKPRGYLQYDADGFMSVSVMHEERPHMTSNDPFFGSMAEKARSAETYLTYCGTYEFTGDTVIHHVELSLFPGWTDADQTRLAKLEGNHLTLSTHPRLLNGIEQTAQLLWERIL